MSRIEQIIELNELAKDYSILDISMPNFHSATPAEIVAFALPYESLPTWYDDARDRPVLIRFLSYQLERRQS
jgi:hypothetical protein